MTSENTEVAQRNQYVATFRAKPSGSQNHLHINPEWVRQPRNLSGFNFGVRRLTTGSAYRVIHAGAKLVAIVPPWNTFLPSIVVDLLNLCGFQRWEC